MLAALRFVLAGVYQISMAEAWNGVAGIAGLVVCAGALCCVVAFQLEGSSAGRCFRRCAAGAPS